MTSPDDDARAVALIRVVLADLDARVEPLLGRPVVRCRGRVVGRIVDDAFLLAPSDAELPPRPSGLHAEVVRPFPGAMPHLRIALSELVPDATPGIAGSTRADGMPVEDTAAAVWIRAAVAATAERLPAIRVPDPPARTPHPRRPRT